MAQLVGEIRVKLTAAQLALVRAEIKAHQSMGDLKLHGDTLVFTDYEGASAFFKRVCAVSTPTTRAFVSRNSILDKIDAAIKQSLDALIARQKEMA